MLQLMIQTHHWMHLNRAGVPSYHRAGGSAEGPGPAGSMGRGQQGELREGEVPGPVL